MTRGEKMQQESMVKDIMGGMPFYICKKADDKPMDAVFVTGKSDVPNKLNGSVYVIETLADLPEYLPSNLRYSAHGGLEKQDMDTREWSSVDFPQILTQAAENKGMYMACDVPMLIKYEDTNVLESGIGTWPKTNWKDTTYQDDNGGWHNRPQVLEAALVGKDIPVFAEGGAIVSTPDGGYEVHTSWGSVSEGKPGQSYLIRYGDDNEDGSPNLNILTATEKSVDTYDVCTKEGKPIMGLTEMNDLVQKERYAEQKATKIQAAFPGIFDDGGKDDVSDDYSK